MDDNYELVLLRVLLRKINQLAVDQSLICDEQRWAKLLESDALTEANRHMGVIEEV